MYYTQALVATVAIISATEGQNIIPQNENCVPKLNNCQKGDLIDQSVADCCYTGVFTCDAVNDGWWDRTVDRAVGDKCQPYACDGNHQFSCGERGTNSRCVCDDTATNSLRFNKCRCQYWPDYIPNHPATEPHTVTTTEHSSTSVELTTKNTKPLTTEPTNDGDKVFEIVVPIVIGVSILLVIFMVIIAFVINKCRLGKYGYTNM